MRRVGHIAVVAVLALAASDVRSYAPGLVAAVTSLGSMVVLDHLWRGHVRRWEQLQPALTLLALLGLLWTAFQGFAARLR